MKTSPHGATPIIPWRPIHAMTIPKLWIRNGPQWLNWATKRLHNPLLCSDRPLPFLLGQESSWARMAAFPCATAFITRGMHSPYICNFVYVSSSFAWFRHFWYPKNIYQEQRQAQYLIKFEFKFEKKIWKFETWRSLWLIGC